MLKAISLKQPFASLVVMGAKKYETRGFYTRHRGRLLIHASLSKDENNLSLCLNEPFRKFVDGINGFYKLPFGKIIGEVMVEDVFATETIRPKIKDTDELLFGDYSIWRYAWRLVRPVVYKDPVYCRGNVGLFDVPTDVLVQLNIRA